MLSGTDRLDVSKNDATGSSYYLWYIAEIYGFRDWWGQVLPLP